MSSILLPWFLQMPLDGPQLAQQGAVFNKNFFEDFKVQQWYSTRLGRCYVIEAGVVGMSASCLRLFFFFSFLAFLRHDRHAKRQLKDKDANTGHGWDFPRPFFSYRRNFSLSAKPPALSARSTPAPLH